MFKINNLLLFALFSGLQRPSRGSSSGFDGRANLALAAGRILARTATEQASAPSALGQRVRDAAGHTRGNGLVGARRRRVRFSNLLDRWWLLRQRRARRQSGAEWQEHELGHPVVVLFGDQARSLQLQFSLV